MVHGVVDDTPIYSLGAQRSADYHVYIPFTSMLRRLNSTAQISISVQAHDIKQVNDVRHYVEDVMEQRRSGRKVKFHIGTSAEALKSYSEGSLAVARLLAAVGTISLVVGGIGVMNIMLVSVTERTREIGIRMALGTRSKHILAHFLVEASVLSSLGGAAGITLGMAASWFVTSINGWPTSVTVPSVTAALLYSLAVGIFFGYHPAQRASSLHPVEALRSET